MTLRASLQYWYHASAPTVALLSIDCCSFLLTPLRLHVCQLMSRMASNAVQYGLYTVITLPLSVQVLSVRTGSPPRWRPSIPEGFCRKQGIGRPFSGMPSLQNMIWTPCFPYPGNASQTGQYIENVMTACTSNPSLFVSRCQMPPLLPECIREWLHISLS